MNLKQLTDEEILTGISNLNAESRLICGIEIPKEEYNLVMFNLERFEEEARQRGLIF